MDVSFYCDEDDAGYGTDTGNKWPTCMSYKFHKRQTCCYMIITMLLILILLA